MFYVTIVIMERAIIHLKPGRHQSCTRCCRSPLPLPHGESQLEDGPTSCQFRLGVETCWASLSPLPSASEANVNLGGVFGVLWVHHLSKTRLSWSYPASSCACFWTAGLQQTPSWADTTTSHLCCSAGRTPASVFCKNQFGGVRPFIAQQFYFSHPRHAGVSSHTDK